MTSLLSLPEDVLLAVLVYLDPKELFSCRVVCRRLRDLCLDRDLWKNVRVRGTQMGVLRAALALAPCLGALSTNWRPIEEVASLVFSTNCVVTELDLRMRDENEAALAIGIILKLSGLGGVKKLVIQVTCDLSNKFTQLLVVVIYNLNGLQELFFYIESLFREDRIPADWCDRQVESSLTKLQYASCHTEPFLELLLRTHAETLECVQLLEVTRDAPVSLLAAMPRLRTLECPLSNDLSQLIALPNLQTVISPYDDRITFYPSGTLDFLRQAQHLKSVEFRGYMMIDENHSAPLLALASSRSAQALESMVVNHVKPDTLEPMLPTLLKFSSLKSLSLDMKPSDNFLHVISRASLPPALTKLTVLYPRTKCLHAWLHHAPVQDLLVRNPRLHLFLPVHLRLKGYNYLNDCSCEWCCDCHKELRARHGEGQSYCFSSHSRKASCPINCFQVAGSPAL